MPDIYNIIKDNYKRFLRFCVVGVINTSIDFVMFSLLYYWLHYPVLMAHAMGYAIAVTNSFCWNFLWTFRSESDRHPVRLTIAFFSVQLCVLGVSCVLLWILKVYMPVLLAKLMVVGVTMFLSYFGNLKLVFTKQAQSRL